MSRRVFTGTVLCRFLLVYLGIGCAVERSQRRDATEPDPGFEHTSTSRQQRGSKPGDEVAWSESGGEKEVATPRGVEPDIPTEPESGSADLPENVRSTTLKDVYSAIESGNYELGLALLESAEMSTPRPPHIYDMKSIVLCGLGDIERAAIAGSRAGDDYQSECGDSRSVHCAVTTGPRGKELAAAGGDECALRVLLAYVRGVGTEELVPGASSLDLSVALCKAGRIHESEKWGHAAAKRGEKVPKCKNKQARPPPA